jgi:hypothetical protein
LDSNLEKATKAFICPDTIAGMHTPCLPLKTCAAGATIVPVEEVDASLVVILKTFDEMPQ